MRIFFLSIFLFIACAVVQAQIYTPIGGNGQRIAGFKVTRALTIPTDTLKPVDKSIDSLGTLAVGPDSLLYYIKGKKYVPVSGGASPAYWDSTTTKLNFPVDTLPNISSLQSYTGKSKIIYVTDTLRGGIFSKRSVGIQDNGTIFNASGGGAWARIFDETMGVMSVCWFGAKGDGITDDTQPIKDAIAAVKKGGAVYFPTRCAPPLSTTYYKVTSTITITTTRIKIFSDAESKGYSTTIYATSGTFPIFTVNIDEVSFWGICMRGNGTFTIIDPASGAGRWAEGATVTGIKLNGDAAANGDIKIQHCGFFYLDTAIALNARNADITNNLFALDKQAVVIGTGTGQIRGFKIENNWLHSIGDTTVGKAAFKCVNPRAFQIWIHNNQLDGQTNCMMADITADSAVQITDNNLTMGRGGLMSITGVNGAVISGNYYLGGSYQTRGDGILLTNTKNIIAAGNTIIQAANNGLWGVNADNTSITNNILKDFSHPKKANAGNFSGIILDANSDGNSVYNNQLTLSSTSYVYGKAVDISSFTTNHVGLNDQFLGTNFSAFKGIEIASPIKVPGLFFQAYDSIRKWDITYRSSDSSLLFSKTGSTNPLRLSDGVTYVDNLFNNSAGQSRLGVGNGNGYISTDSNIGGSDGGFFGYYPAGTASNVLNITGASASPLRSLRLAADSLRLGNSTVGSSSVMTVNGSLVWHAGNDGAGSGLDADLLDGLNSTSFAQAATTLTMANGSGISITGGTQDLSANRTWTFTNTGILNQVASEEAKSFWVQFGTMRTLSLKGTTNPLISLNDGTNGVANIQLTTGRLDFNNPNTYTSFTGTANVGIATGTPNSSLQVAGAFSLPIRTITANRTLDNTDHTIRATTSGITITLPTASTCTGRIYIIVNYNSGGTITLTSYLNNGAAGPTIGNNLKVWVQSDGTNWYQIN